MYHCDKLTSCVIDTCFTLDAALHRPPYVGDVSVVATRKTRAKLAWTAIESISRVEPASGFILFLQELSGEGESQRLMIYKPRVCIGRISYVVTNLKPCTTYAIRVASIAGTYFGLPSEPEMFSTRGGKRRMYICMYTFLRNAF